MKAIPAPDDLLPGNNRVLFGRNMVQPSPDDGRSTREQGLGWDRLAENFTGFSGNKSWIHEETII